MSRNHSTVIMVPPDGFQHNPQTASSNAFQSVLAINDIQAKAMAEFTAMVTLLKKQGINVLLLKQDQRLPDAVFPNNWFSTHLDAAGKRQLMLYPLLTKNRQAEVNLPGLLALCAAANIVIDGIIDLRKAAAGVLEGTGSLVLDRKNKCLYAAISDRSSSVMVNKAAQILGYTAIVFNSTDSQNQPIYHTNVLMGLAQHYAIVCLEAIINPADQARILDNLTQTNKIIIPITLEQMNHMCGNVYELFDATGTSHLLLSNQAMTHFTAEQLHDMQRFSSLLPVTIPIIETVGGGSARCMIAEIV